MKPRLSPEAIANQQDDLAVPETKIYQMRSHMRLTDDAWADLAAHLPIQQSPAAISSFRREVDTVLWLFMHQKSFVEYGKEVVEEISDGKSTWKTIDLVQEYKRCSRAAREFLEASYILPWEDEGPFVELETLLDRVEKIEAECDARAVEIEDYKKSLPRKAGRPSEKGIMFAIEGLTRVWMRAGGGMGSSLQGPLIRFLLAALTLALITPPTNEQVRHWVRRWKADRRGEKAND
jgi:hypothetical protein